MVQRVQKKIRNELTHGKNLKPPGEETATAEADMNGGAREEIRGGEYRK